MFVSSKQGVNKIMADPPVLEVAEEQLHVSESEKLLGIHLHNTMSWASHVEAIIEKCNSLLSLKQNQTISVITNKEAFL